MQPVQFHFRLGAKRSANLARDDLLDPRGDINDVQACIELLRDGGFTPVEVRKVAAAATVPSVSALLDLLVKGTARASALISSQPPEVLPAVISALETALEQYRVGTNFQVPAVAIFSVGTRL